MERLKSAALSALDTQLDFINYYQTDEGIRMVMYFVQDLVNKAYVTPPTEDFAEGEYALKTGARIAQELLEHLDTAATYYITDEMFDLNFHAAAQLPDIKFRREMLPSEAGFVVLPQPLVVADVHNKRMSTRALAWWQSEVNRVSHDGQVTRAPVMMFCAFSNKKDADVDDMMISLRQENPAEWLRWRQWQLCHWAYIDFDRDNRYLNADMERFGELSGTPVGSVYAFIKSFFLLVQQRVAHVEREVPNRGGMRRWTGAGLAPEYGEVQVVTLRRERAESTHGGESEEAHYSHRFWVSGHWQGYWCGSGDDKHLEQIFKPSYIKGPVDKPLIIKDKVFVWKQ